MKELAEVLHMTPPSITALVRRLEQTDLLERVRHSSDSRIWLVRLTDQGTTLMTILRQQRIQLMQHLLDTLHPDDQQILLDLLECAVTTAEDLIKTSDGSG
jgi:DNA-binding MarR family transcriptional regulator